MKTMKIKDFTCELHMPDKVSDDKVNQLPPYAHTHAYRVDDYERSASKWPKSSKDIGSYFVGVREDKGLWLDFNDNNNLDHDVAIVISIQGVNPITGQPTELRLEQYEKKCPVHNVNFEENRHCPKCGFCWPAQNYISTTGTTVGRLWLYGFRMPDGKVRQYVFTADELKGIASQIVGDKRPYSIGIAFYREFP